MTKSMMIGFIAIALFDAGLGMTLRGSANISEVPRDRYRQECGTSSDLKIIPQAAALLQQHNVPGAGIKKFKPFETVLKDGWMPVDCVKDYMYYRGDKFGDNKHDYKLRDTSNVSIVHYDAFVAKEDRVEMTQKVCFEFCRTVPNMGFFGIVNGRGCYCTPYFQAMESDSRLCDAVCEGDKGNMCGGKEKSSIFSMHFCDSSEDDLKAMVSKAKELGKAQDLTARKLQYGLDEIQNKATEFQKYLGSAGDTVATGLFQEAKVWAGEIQAQEKALSKLVDKIKELTGKDIGSDFTDPEVVTKAERLMEDLDATVTLATEEGDKADKMMELMHPNSTQDEDQVKDAADQYIPVMYFIDKDFTYMPATCGGDRIGKTMPGLSAGQCARACDLKVGSCVAFQLMDGLCFLFSKLESATYYTGCAGKVPEGVADFLQGAGNFNSTEDAEDAEYLEALKSELPELGPRVECFAKLSKFVGTNLTPDPSGKNSFVLKKLTEADRCYIPRPKKQIVKWFRKVYTKKISYKKCTERKMKYFATMSPRPYCVSWSIGHKIARQVEYFKKVVWVDALL